MVEVKNKKEKFLLGFLIGAFFVLNGIVFAGYLFNDSQSSDITIQGNNQTIQTTTSLTKNLVIISTNTTENIIYSDYVTYFVDVNRTVNFTPTIQKTLLDAQCLNYENDCEIKFYLWTYDKQSWFEHDVSPKFTNPFTFVGKGESELSPQGENKIKYEISCIPTSCRQNININFTLQEV